MIGRALRVALPCALLASLPALAETYTIRVTFQNKSDRAAVANWRNNDEGLTIITTEVPAGAAPEWATQRVAGRPTDESVKYDLSFTAAGGSKCSATLHVTWQYHSAMQMRFMSCTVIDRTSNGPPCDSASETRSHTDKTCYAAFALLP